MEYKFCVAEINDIISREKFVYPMNKIRCWN